MFTATTFGRGGLYKLSSFGKLKNDNTYHHGDLRNALIDAALALIDEKGINAFTIREIAKRAGVSHAAPYRHFKDREALLFAVAKEGFDMMVAETKKRSRKYPDDPLARFQISGLSYIDFAISHPSHYRVMFNSGESIGNFPEDLTISSTESFKLLFDTICECQEKNLIKQGNPHDFAMAAWSIVHGYAKLYIDGFIDSEAGNFSHSKTKLKYIITDALYSGLRSED